MLYLRRFLFLLLQWLSTILMFPIVLIALFLPSVARGRLISIWARFNVLIMRYICGLSFRVHGKENIPNEPSIIISNHQSAWETLAFQSIFPVQSYILKRELLWIPFFGWGLAANHPIAINRSQKHRAMLKLILDSRKRLEVGRFIVIFPEGTRQPYGQPAKFQVGGAKIAKEVNSQVVPVAHNAGKFWPKKAKFIKPGVVDVVIGEPISPQDYNVRELNKVVEQRVLEQMEQIENFS